MITKSKIDFWKGNVINEVFPNIIRALDPQKLARSPYYPLSATRFEEVCATIEENKQKEGAKLERHYQHLQAFKMIDANLKKCYIEVIPETDGKNIFSTEKFHLNMTYDDFYTQKQLERSNCLEICKYMNLRKLDRTAKTIKDTVYTRFSITKTDILLDNKTNAIKMEVVKKLFEHYSALYSADDKDDKKMAFLDIMELMRVRPRDKALWFNITGGFGKDVLISIIANFWSHRIFTKDIHDDMSNAPRVKAENELERTNAEIWNRPELKADAKKDDIERRVQSIKTHTGRTSDIVEMNGDMRVNSAFTIETTNADLQLRNDRDVARRFIVFKFEGDPLIETLTSRQIEGFIAGDYDNELAEYYYEYVECGANIAYMDRLTKYSTPLSEVIDEETKEARSIIPASWRECEYIPSVWIDNFVARNKERFEGMKLKEKINILGLGGAESKAFKVVQIGQNNEKVRKTKTLSARKNKFAKINATMPIVEQHGTFNDEGVFVENKRK